MEDAIHAVRDLLEHPLERAGIWLARCLQPDPVIQDPLAPQLRNPYSYVANSLTRLDLSPEVDLPRGTRRTGLREKKDRH